MSIINSVNNKDGFLVCLGDDKSTEIVSVGGKGASLGKLVKAGFPVPSGFVIMTYAYEEFLHANGLQVEIENILSGLDYEKLEELDKKTRQIRNTIIVSKIPHNLTREILQA